MYLYVKVQSQITLWAVTKLRKHFFNPKVPISNNSKLQNLKDKASSSF